MIDFKTIAGGVAIAGTLGFTALGLGTGIANAAPAPGAPQVTSVQDAGQSNAPTPPRPTQPSPYAAYGSGSICGTPGLYFVNICE
jgi:hypothetical protein